MPDSRRTQEEDLENVEGTMPQTQSSVADLVVEKVIDPVVNLYTVN